MSNEETAGRRGLGCFMVMFLIFVTLKLCDKIDWSWWWVTAPIWGPAGAFLLFLAFCVFMAWVTGQLK